jgi:hypothetical protein
MRDPSGLDLLMSHDFPNRYVTTLGAKFIMSFFGFLSIPDSQNFALSRRELLGKISAIGVVSLLPKPQSKFSYPSPEFKIGDLVASDWNPDEEDDDAPESATDFGEVLGMRWLPESESGLDAKTWVYYVWWTHSTISGTCFPCYDGESTRECDLRLVSATEKICKR